MAVLMVRTALTADDSFAAMRARSRFGIAIAAIIRMMATTINNSISEKPLSRRISLQLPQKIFLILKLTLLNELHLVGRSKRVAPMAASASRRACSPRQSFGVVKAE